MKTNGFLWQPYDFEGTPSNNSRKDEKSNKSSSNNEPIVSLKEASIVDYDK